MDNADGRCGLNPFKITPHLLKQHICTTIFTHSQFLHQF